MGLIDQNEARDRRAELEKEASFYGAMDGASKFVKGDSIAGIIILLIDIIAGLIIGVVQMGMDWQEALQTFTLLTIGDGIATQLPALIIAIATGIIVTRSSADRELSTEVLKQLSSVPRVPLMVTGILCLVLLLPGMPKWPIVVLLGLMFYFWTRMGRAETAADNEAEDADEAAASSTKAFPTLSVALGSVLADSWKSDGAVLMDRVTSLRKTHESAFGIGFPAIQILDGPQLGSHEYEIRLFGTRYARGEIELDHMMAIETEDSRGPIEGIETRDPSYGLRAVWVRENRAESAREAGYTIVDPMTVFITHLGEVLRQEAPTLLTRASVASLLEEVRIRQPGLIEELVPTLLSVSDIQRLLQNLLAEAVPIGNLDLIVEYLVDLARTEKDVGALTELVRQRMSYTICNKLRDRHKELAVLSLDPRIENQILASVTASGRQDTLGVDPKLADQLIRKLSSLADDMFRQGRSPVLLCGGGIRRQLRALTRRSIPRLSILSVSEIPLTIELRSQGIVRVDADQAPNVTTLERGSVKGVDPASSAPSNLGGAGQIG